MFAFIPAGPIGVLIWFIVLVAIVAIAYKVLVHFGVRMPAVLVEIFWIVVIVAVAVWAIVFLASLAGGGVL